LCGHCFECDVARLPSENLEYNTKRIRDLERDLAIVSSKIQKYEEEGETTIIELSKEAVIESITRLADKVPVP